MVFYPLIHFNLVVTLEINQKPTEDQKAVAYFHSKGQCVAKGLSLHNKTTLGKSSHSRALEVKASLTYQLVGVSVISIMNIPISDPT